MRARTSIKLGECDLDLVIIRHMMKSSCDGNRKRETSGCGKDVLTTVRWNGATIEGRL